MKTTDRIPSKKIERAGKLVKTGLKVGKNYLTYYGEKLVSNSEKAKEKLNENNAEPQVGTNAKHGKKYASPSVC